MNKSEYLKIVGERVKAIRLEKNLTQLDLVGRMAGEIDPTNISRIESGRTNPTIFTIYRLAEALEVPVSDFFKLEELSLEL